MIRNAFSFSPKNWYILTQLKHLICFDWHSKHWSICIACQAPYYQLIRLHWYAIKMNQTFWWSLAYVETFDTFWLTSQKLIHWYCPGNARLCITILLWNLVIDDRSICHSGKVRFLTIKPKRQWCFLLKILGFEGAVWVSQCYHTIFGLRTTVFQP